jgi:hypothetical protein
LTSDDSVRATFTQIESSCDSQRHMQFLLFVRSLVQSQAESLMHLGL